MTTPSRMLELANAIAEDAFHLKQYFDSQNVPEPSFDIDAPTKLTFSDLDLADRHERLLAGTWELHHLALGPVASLRSLNASSGELLALSVVHRFKIVQHVPLHDQISFHDLASATSIPLAELKRIIRLAISCWIFKEPTPGMVAHTASSKLLREDRLVQSIIGIGCEEFFPGAAKVADSLQKYPGSEEPILSGWALANNATLPMFSELSAHHPQRAADFASAMEFMASIVPASSAITAFDWANLGQGRVVDVGGGKGPVSIALARAFPNLSIVVQDLEETVSDGRRRLPEDVQDRITFMAHDFFTPQPIKDADVYFFRAVFHNWPDQYCVRILQNLIPALKKGARVLIQDPLMPERDAVSPWTYREHIAANIRMMILFNSHDRELGEWSSLFAKADPRFQFQGVKSMPAGGDHLNMLEAIWEG